MLVTATGPNGPQQYRMLVTTTGPNGPQQYRMLVTTTGPNGTQQYRMLVTATGPNGPQQYRMLVTTTGPNGQQQSCSKALLLYSVYTTSKGSPRRLFSCDFNYCVSQDLKVFLIAILSCTGCIQRYKYL